VLKKITLLIIMMLALTGCKEMLQDKLTSRDAAQMALVLQNSGIDVERRTSTDGSYELWVEEQETVRALQILQKAGLPKEDYQSLDQVFPGGGFIQTPMEQQARFMHAMNQELSRTISEIDGVTAARVHVVTPDQAGSARVKTRASASVAVHYISTLDPNTLADRIRIIVANAVPDLNFRDVSIAFFPVNLDGSGGTSPLSATPVVASRGLSPTRIIAIIIGLMAMGYGVFLYARDRQWIV
jgi:type III secretion protein J